MKKKTSEIIISAAITSWLYRLFTALYGIIVIPLIIIKLTKEEYGLWLIIGQTVSILAISDFGIANAISRFTAKYRGECDNESVSILYSTAYFWMFILAFIIIVLSFVISPYIPSLLGVQQKYTDITKQLFLICCTSLGLQFPLKLGMGILTGHQIYGLHSIAKILNVILNFISLIVLYYYDLINLYNLALITSLNIILADIIQTFVAYYHTKPWGISIRKANFLMTKTIISYGSSASLNVVSKMIYDRLIIIFTGKLMGLGLAGVFGFSQVVMNNIIPILSSVGSPLITLSSEWNVNREVNRIKSANLVLSRIVFISSAIFFCFVLFYAKEVFGLILSKSKWAERDYDTLYISLAIMSFGTLLGIAQTVLTGSIQAMGQHWQVTRGTIISSVLAFSTFMILSSITNSIIGASIGWSMFFIIQGTIIFPALIRKYLIIDFKTMFIDIYLPGLKVIFYCAISALVINLIIAEASAVFIIIKVLIFLFINLCLLIYFSGKKNEILFLLRRLF